MIITNKHTCQTGCDWPNCTLNGCIVKALPEPSSKDDQIKQLIEIILHREQEIKELRQQLKANPADYEL